MVRTEQKFQAALGDGDGVVEESVCRAMKGCVVAQKRARLKLDWLNFEVLNPKRCSLDENTSSRYVTFISAYIDPA